MEIFTKEYWRKKTKQEHDRIVYQERDYTAGYKFWAWMLYKRFWGYFCPAQMVFMILPIAYPLTSYDPSEPLVALWVALGSIAASAFIWFKLVQEFHRKKKGISQ